MQLRHCPKCGNELDKLSCLECGVQDVRDMVYNTDFSHEVVHQVLLSRGACKHTGRNALMLPLQSGRNPVFFSLSQPSGRELSDLHGWITDWASFSKKKYTPQYAGDYLRQVREGHLSMPIVEGEIAHPFLVEQGDTLVGPNCTSARSRLNTQLKLYYTGEELLPERNGAFEEFLDSVKYMDDESRLVVKQFMLSMICQRMMPPGSMPMLVFSANKPGAGKTTTAELLLELFGAGKLLLLPWDDIKQRIKLLPRHLIGPDYAGVLLDNLSANERAATVSSPGLSSILTQAQLHTTKMYEHYGTISWPNWFAYLATANNPRLITDLFNRSIFCELDYWKPQCRKWKEEWNERSRELMADIMFTAIENWKKGPFKCNPPRGYRFNDWYETVARLLQEEPVICPRNCTALHPVDVAMGVMWGYYGGERTSMPLVEAVQQINTGAGPALKEFREQGGWAVDDVAAELRRFGKMFKLEEVNGCLHVLPDPNYALTSQTPSGQSSATPAAAADQT